MHRLDRCPADRPGSRRTGLGVVTALSLAVLPAVHAAEPATAAARPVKPTATSPTQPVQAIRLIASPTPVVDAAGNIWSPDARFADGGTAFVGTGDVAGTTADNLFLPERWGVRGYDVPVPARGAYKVTINAAEITFNRPSQRVFSVSAEGARVASGIDLVKAVGARTAYTLTFVTTVSDGVLDLDLAASVNSSKISSLVVQPLTATPVVARVVAGTTAVTDGTGVTWSPDARYADGGTAWRSTAAIGGTTQDALFQGERWGVKGYSIPVPAKGTYRVTLNEAELAFSRAGQRVFDVVAEGRAALTGVDVAKDVGYNTAWTSSFTTSVTDGALTLTLPASVNSAKIASMLVQWVPATEAALRQKPVVAPVPTVEAAPSAGFTGPENVFGSKLTVDPIAPRGGGFGPSSVWRTDIRDAPLASTSDIMVANLASQVARYYGGNAAFNVWQYQGNFWTVGATQARVDLKWDDCQGKGYLPRGLYGDGGQFVSVPVPAVAGGSAGNDSSISIYQPSTDTLWSYWKLRKAADGWHACWGGRVDKVSQSPGYFEGGFGTTATGLAGEGGMVNIADVRAGRIDHALSLALVNVASWKVVSWPAQRSDGGSDNSPDAIPEGSRLRLDPAVDVDSLKLHPIAKMIARAAQTYGFIVTDKAGTVGVSAEGGLSAEAHTGVNPWNGLMAGTPSYGIMAGFPWSKLQVLPKDYGKPTG